MSARALNIYQRVNQETASPVRLLDQLYARLLRDIDDAAAMIAAKEVGAKGAAISHAIAIVSELVAGLDFGLAPEMCAGLKKLYDFVSDRLTEANMRIDAKPLGEARKIVVVLRQSFEEAAEARW